MSSLNQSSKLGIPITTQRSPWAHMFLHGWVQSKILSSLTTGKEQGNLLCVNLEIGTAVNCSIFYL